MIKRIIAAAAALLMIFGSTMIEQPQAEGRPVIETEEESNGRLMGYKLPGGVPEEGTEGREGDGEDNAADMEAADPDRNDPGTDDSGSGEVSGRTGGGLDDERNEPGGSNIESDGFGAETDVRDDDSLYGGTPAEDSGAFGGAEPEPEGADPGDEADSGADEVEDTTFGGEDTTFEGQDATIEVDTEPEAPQMEYLGEWTISFYCPCSECCGEWAGGPTASGAMPSAWWTAATGDLPFGTILYVDGLGTFEVQDRGTGYGWLDIFVGSHDEALANGLQTRSVYIAR